VPTSHEYSVRLEKFAAAIAAKQRQHILVGNIKIAVVIAGLILVWISVDKEWLSPYWLLLPFCVYATLAVLHEQVLRARRRAETAATFYRKGVARIEDRWAGTGQTGDRFRDEKHVYAEDLDLFGRGGLFELLSTARLPMGENQLAHWLLFPSSRDAILERQGLLQELRDKLDLREDLAVTGEDLRIRLNPESLVDWAGGRQILPKSPWRLVAAVLALGNVAAIIYYFVGGSYRIALILLALDAGFRRALKQRAHAVIHGASCNAEGLLLFSQILQRLEREQFVAPRLQTLSAELIAEGRRASRAIRQLARIVYWVDAEHSLLAHLAELPFLYSIQVAFVAEAWRACFGRSMRRWVEITGEIEALLSLAAYSFEHPADPFPEFMNAENPEAAFHAEGLGHPLIPADRCVHNNVRLDSETRVLLVSGSNMSGKSTLLRAVGINAVLAMAGAPVRAKSLRLTPLAIGTRIRSTDSLQEGRSGFYTEILHIRAVFNMAESSKVPLLFLFDELLEGTNSKDRRIGAEGLLRALLDRGAIGIVTTHDLALTEIGQSLGSRLRNMHFQDYVENGQMRFDYTLRDGVVAKSNAIELMRLIGLQV
jgi:MutS-like protein